eukprot:jgi/Astpho2/7083/Aster-01915
MQLSATLTRPVVPSRSATVARQPGTARSSTFLNAGKDRPADDTNTWDTAETKGRQGVAAAARQWPPKPITDHGAPRPEDDPANFEGGKRVRGPSESEVKKAQEERRKKSPYTSKREGGTQAGGGGEGSGA